MCACGAMGRWNAKSGRTWRIARSRGSPAVRPPKRKPWAGWASAAPVGGLVAAILSSAPLRLRITAHDEQFGDTRADLVGLPCAEGIVAHVNAFNGASWRDLANPNLHLQYETKVRCCVTKVTTCGGRILLGRSEGDVRARLVPATRRYS